MVLSMMSDGYAWKRALQSTSKSNLNRTVSQNSPWDCENTRLRNLCQQLGPRTVLKTWHGNHHKRPGETTRQTQQAQAGAPRVPVCLHGQWDTAKARIPLISTALEDITTVSCSQSTGKQESSWGSQEKRHEGFESPSQISQRKQWHPTPVLLPGKSHGRRSLVGCSPWGREELDMTERLHFHFSLSCIGAGNANPLQCSCLANPRDGGAWWAAIYGVTQSRTRLKWLSSSSSTNLRVDLEKFEKDGYPEAGKSSLEPPENTVLCPLHCDFLSEGRFLGKKSLMKCLETLLSISMLIQHVNLIKSFAIWKKWFHFCTQKPSF